MKRLELLGILNPAITRIESALFLANRPFIGQAIRAEFSQLRHQISTWFEQSLYVSETRSRTEAADDLVNSMTPQQMRVNSGFNFDRQGWPVPAPGNPPPDLQDLETISKLEVFLLLSPLLAVAGSQIQAQRTPVREVVLGEEFFRRSASERFRADVANHWRIRLAATLRTLDDIAFRMEVKIRQEVERRKVAALLRSAMALRVDESGFASRVLSDLRHENLRTKGTIDDEIYREQPVVAGYRLNSRFLPTTAPDHAARDGVKFYKDNRPGSYSNWSERLIPPYRVNCVCFTTPLLEDELRNELEPAFGIQFSRQKPITIRDVGTFSSWFDQQRPGIQRHVMGDRRWFAAASAGIGRVGYADFVKPNGHLMQPRELLAESIQQRNLRRQESAIVIRLQSERFREAWRSAGGRFDSSPELEAEYRKQLENFLRRVN